MVDLYAIVERLEAGLGAAEGSPVALAGGITNHNYRVRFGGIDYVLRVAGENTSLLGINRESERVAGEAAARLGIGPQVAAATGDYLVTRYIEGAPLDSSLLRADPEPVATALRAFHDCGVQLPVRFWVPELLDDYERVIRAPGSELPEGYSSAQTLARRIAEVLPLNEPVPCHDDLLASNMLRTHSDLQSSEPPWAAIVFVDWEYAGMGHRMFDLGNLAVNGEFDEASERRLLTAYFREPASPARHAALRLMRLMSDAREAAWGVVQNSVSELDFDFAGYAARHFARLAHAASDSRLEDWFDAASA